MFYSHLPLSSPRAQIVDRQLKRNDVSMESNTGVKLGIRASSANNCKVELHLHADEVYVIVRDKKQNSSKHRALRHVTDTDNWTKRRKTTFDF
jgi:hypothetical protein